MGLIRQESRRAALDARLRHDELFPVRHALSWFLGLMRPPGLDSSCHVIFLHDCGISLFQTGPENRGPVKKRSASLSEKQGVF